MTVLDLDEAKLKLLREKISDRLTTLLSSPEVMKRVVAETDLLIGALFEDKVDKVWQPMESLYPPGKCPIAPWFAGTPATETEDKANELVLPEGRRP